MPVAIQTSHSSFIQASSEFIWGIPAKSNGLPHE